MVAMFCMNLVTCRHFYFDWGIIILKKRQLVVIQCN